MKMELNKDNYYSKDADIEYMSYSQFKDFEECPAKAMAKINKEWDDEQSESMLIGGFVDAWLDGESGKFAVDHPDIYNIRTGELKANFKKAQELCWEIKKDELLYNNLKGIRQFIVTGNIAGVKFKGKIDSLLADEIHDGKVVKDCEEIYKNGEKMPFYMAYGYDKQAVIYQTLYQQMTGKKLPFYLDVITKEKVPDKRIFMFGENTLDNALQEIIAKAPVYDAIKKGQEPVWYCGKCDYCKSIKKLTKDDIEEI